MSAVASPSHAQLFVELRADDAEAASAFAVARASLEAARSLRSLRRFRVFELQGRLPDRATVSALLHASTQFYNPAKERGLVRMGPADAAPLEPGDVLVLVFDRGAERRPAAERWWRHETGERVEVREAVGWALGFEPPADAVALAGELAVAVDRRHGLLCNPNGQEWRIATAGEVPVDGMKRTKTKRPARARKEPRT